MVFKKMKKINFQALIKWRSNHKTMLHFSNCSLKKQTIKTLGIFLKLHSTGFWTLFCFTHDNKEYRCRI